MGLLDLFSGRASETAARNNAAAIRAGQTLAADGLTKGYGAATNFLGLGPDGGGALGALGGGFRQARSDINAAGDKTQGYLGQAADAYAPIVQQGAPALGAYYDAIGANGADGSERAQANFRAAPGYAFQQGQGLETIMRTAATRGGLAGGNTTADLLRFSQGLADQSFQQYADNLRGGTGIYAGGVQYRAGVLGQQATAAQGQGTALGALGTGLGAGEATIYGSGANLQAGFGRDVAGVQTGAAGATITNNNALAAAKNAAGANVLGALIGFGQLASGGAGGAAGRVAGGGDGSRPLAGRCPTLTIRQPTGAEGSPPHSGALTRMADRGGKQPEACQPTPVGPSMTRRTRRASSKRL